MSLENTEAVSCVCLDTNREMGVWQASQKRPKQESQITRRLNCNQTYSRPKPKSNVSLRIFA